MMRHLSFRDADFAESGAVPHDRTRHARRALAVGLSLALGWASITQAAVAEAAPAAPGWTAFVDTNADVNTSTTDANALSLTSPTGTGVLKNILDGSELTGVEVTGSTTGTVTKSGSSVPAFADGTDAAGIFGGIVDFSSPLQIDSGSTASLVFSGLDPDRTYELATTANRDRAGTTFPDRTTTFSLIGADAFTNASSTGTAANAGGDEVTFYTGDNTANGYVAKWTGIQPGTDGEITLTSAGDPGFGDFTFAASAVMLGLDEVPDTTAPVITLLGDAVLNLTVGDTFDDPGATASDDVDGDLTGAIVVGGDTVDTSTVGTYVITYDVTDDAGNPATQVTRTVQVAAGPDTTAPVITLLGDAVLNLTVGDTFDDPGATASDDVDGDLTGAIVVGGDTVDTSTVGTYVITYDVEDAAGNAATQVTRTVKVGAVAIENTAAPVITGDALIGATLTADPGSWTPDTVDLAYQWYSGTAAIGGATASIYVVQKSDKGKALHVEVTASGSGYSPVTAASAETSVVPAVAALHTVRPRIQGTRRVGEMLTAVPGAWQPEPVEYGYKWYRSGTRITGATDETYTLVAKDKGKRITVKVTGAKVGHATASRTSARTGKIAAGILSWTRPVISGTPEVGQTLSVDTGAWGPPGVSLSIRWLRNGTSIKKATGPNYALGAADKGKKISVRVTGSLKGYTSKSKISEVTAKVVAPQP